MLSFSPLIKEDIKPIIVIHGGISHDNSVKGQDMYRDILGDIISTVYPILLKKGANVAVIEAIKLLEDNELFNAGKGSKIQSDGQIRMSAALMSGTYSKFAAVMSIQNVQHPIEVAELLISQKYSIIAGNEATQFARHNGVPAFNPITFYRTKEYSDKLESDSGTVGAVALDGSGNIWAGTSTGGTGYETPGRVGDSPTVAGTYATPSVGISCTGKGEHIINLAVAAKVADRVDMGMELSDAINLIIRQGYESNFGLIALDKFGNIEIGETKDTNVMYAYHNGQNIYTF